MSEGVNTDFGDTKDKKGYQSKYERMSQVAWGGCEEYHR